MKSLGVYSGKAAHKRSFPELISRVEQLISEANDLLKELRSHQDEHHMLVQDFKAAMRPGTRTVRHNNRALSD